MQKFFAALAPATLISVIALAACQPVANGAASDTADTRLDIPEVADGDISVETLKSVTQQLSSDAFEGRSPGTPGEEKTLALLTDKFAKAGLKPGNNGSWFQDVPLVGIEATNVSPLTVTAGGQKMAFDYGSQMVVASYRETPKTDINNSDIVFVGYGINAPERGWNDYAGVDVKGKTVIILVNDPDYETQELKGDFGGRAMTYYGRWTYKYEEAARQGAAAALIVHDTEPAAYGWNVVESSWSGPQFYPQSDNGGSDQTMANGWVQKDVAAKILNAAGMDLATLSKEAKVKGFKARPLNATASVSFDNSITKTRSKNVIGILPGTKRPDEYVLYTAHWDHLGRCKPAPDGDDICNGAVDNATGTAALVALAEAFSKAGAPDRSVVFLAVTAEESGLLGSKYYADNPVYPLAKTVGGINMDAFPMTGPARDVTVVGGGKSQLDEFLNVALKDAGRTATPESTPEKGFYYRSDHFSFAKRGVPMVYVEGGKDLAEGGTAAGEAAAKDYEENRYHGPKDEYDPNWNWDGVVADVQLFYHIGRELAMSTSWPNWVKGDEFRKTRDESRKDVK